MYEEIYKLLLLNSRTFSGSAAKANFQRIIRIVHPDKNKAPEAKRVAQAVIKANEILNDPIKRAYYGRFGTPSDSEEFDREEATETIRLLTKLLNDHEREKETSSGEQSSSPENSTQSGSSPADPIIIVDEEMDESDTEVETEEPSKADKWTSTDDLQEFIDSQKDEEADDMETNKITKIFGLRTRKGITRFKVKWSQYPEPRGEPEETLIKERSALRKWLREVKAQSQRKFESLLKYHPNFKNVL